MIVDQELTICYILSMNKLTELRIKNNLKIIDMANKLHISPTFYWQIENKKRTLTYTMAIKIANIFKLKPDQIFYNEYKNI